MAKQLAPGYRCPITALLLFVSPLQVTTPANEMALAAGTRASPARGTVWLGAVKGPSSSSTQLLTALKQREDTSVPALQQPHQLLSLHSEFHGMLLALVSHPAVTPASAP